MELKSCRAHKIPSTFMETLGDRLPRAATFSSSLLLLLGRSGRSEARIRYKSDTVYKNGRLMPSAHNCCQSHFCAVGFNSWALKSWNGAQQSRKVSSIPRRESKGRHFYGWLRKLGPVSPTKGSDSQPHSLPTRPNPQLDSNSTQTMVKPLTRGLKLFLCQTFVHGHN